MQLHWSLSVLAFALVINLLASPAAAQDLGPLVELSRPNAVGTCNDGFNLFGSWPTGEAEEPFVAMNPISPNNVVAAWIQGPFQDIIATVSNDGGQTWQQAVMPFTLCSGGRFLGSGDPWLSFAPDGDLHAIALAGNTSNEVVVSNSNDGGLHWSPAILVTGSGDLSPDHPSITADPTNASLVYAVWNGTNSKHSSASVFSRTKDGGVAWETPRAIVQTPPQTYIQFSQILPLPNGSLVDIYEFYEQQPNKPITQTRLEISRSSDHGQTWSAPIDGVTMTPLYTPIGNTMILDPETGQLVADPTNPSFAVDSRSGNLYAVWEDGRFSNFQYNDVAFSMSADGGLTWSTPIRVNHTPLRVPPANRQAFFPSIAVAGNGTIGVSYYDFRFNNTSPGLATDRWLIQCHPSSTKSATSATNWNNEIRLTNTSFNMEAVVPSLTGKFFLGDYFGLVGTSEGFAAVFAQPDDNNVTSIFWRRDGL